MDSPFLPAKLWLVSVTFESGSSGHNLGPILNCWINPRCGQWFRHLKKKKLSNNLSCVSKLWHTVLCDGPQLLVTIKHTLVSHTVAVGACSLVTMDPYAVIYVYEQMYRQSGRGKQLNSGCGHIGNHWETKNKPKWQGAGDCGSFK